MQIEVSFSLSLRTVNSIVIIVRIEKFRIGALDSRRGSTAGKLLLELLRTMTAKDTGKGNDEVFVKA